jgi:ubiquinone/menaquinone biosynthesis C-methylase UbiE
MKYDKFGLCLDSYIQSKNVAEIYYKRAIGKLPEQESSKIIAKKVKLICKKNFSILDVGAGCGQDYRSLKKEIKYPFFYTGIDPNKIFVGKGKIAWKNEHNVTFKNGNAYKVPFKENSFDIVMCNNVLHRLIKIENVIKEMLRVTKKYLVIRSHIHDRSYKIQLVHNNKWQKYSKIKPQNEFDKEGNPRGFSYFNIFSEGYINHLVKKYAPKSKIKIIEDTFFDSKKINSSSKNQKRAFGTKVINGKQVSDLVILPLKILIIKKL